MRSMCIAGVVAAGLAVPLEPAHADWRDGCPAGYVQDYHPSSQLGAAAEAESALTSNRILLGTDPSYHTARGDLPRSTTYDFFGHFQWLITHGFTVGATFSYLYHREGAAREWWSGPLVGSIGYRYNYPGDKDIRRALVIQFIGGREFGHSSDIDAYRREAAFRAFDGYLLSSNVLGGMGEYRLEQIGCYSVFAHIRGGALWTGHGDRSPSPSSVAGIGEPVLTVPVTLAVGAYVEDQLALIGEYGVALQRPEDVSRYASTQRLRVVLDYTVKQLQLSVNAHIEFASHVDGIIAGAYVAFNW